MRPQRHGTIATYGHLMNYDTKNISNLVGTYRSAGKNGDIRELCAGILAANRHDVFILAAAGAALAGEQHCHPSIASMFNNIAVSELLRRGDAFLKSGSRQEAVACYEAAFAFPVMDTEPFRRMAAVYHAGEHRCRLGNDDTATSLQCYKTPVGTYFLPNDAVDDVICLHMRAGRVFDLDVVEEAFRHLKPGTTVLDVGANFGQMSVIFAAAVGSTGSVLSFEAQEFVYQVLLKNLQENRSSNVKAVHAAVMEDSVGHVRFPKPDLSRLPSYGSFGVDPAADAGPEVKKLCIDDLPIDTPISFMKIDVQGADLAVMRGARRTIERHRMPIIFEYEAAYDRKFAVEFSHYEHFIKDINYRIDRVIGDRNYVIVPA